MKENNNKKIKEVKNISVFLQAVVSLSITTGDKQLCVCRHGWCDGLGTE